MKLIIVITLLAKTNRSNEQPGSSLPGTAPEFFRYRSVYVSLPTEDDRTEALRRSRFVQCDVCTQILSHLRISEVSDEDRALDLLEGDIQDTRTSIPIDIQMERVLKSKRGCQRHFKDSLMALGWKLVACERNQFCIHKGTPRDADDMDTYTVENEALFYACENTIGANIDQIARLATKSRTTTGELCKRAAKCANSNRLEL
jgi:hypothetical protein